VIDRLEFASCYAYSPRGTTEPSLQSKQLCYRIKAGDAEAIRLAAERVRALHESGAFPGYFGTDVTLVAVPGRAPLAPGAVSRTERICDALLACGLAKDVVMLLERVEPVQKSAYAAPVERPSALEHHATIAVARTLLVPTRVLLVDDVVTRGATLLGAASRLKDAFPECEERGFALVRTESFDEVTEVRDPRVGIIDVARTGKALRRP
jgi:hypothetical protein